MAAMTTSTPEKRGRKPASESRAVEIRTKLLAWKQTPESVRPSLRALAAELGVSHQLLSYHLKRVDDWRIDQRDSELKREYAAISERARSENRPLTEDEIARCRAILGEQIGLLELACWKAIERAAPNDKLLAKSLQSRARAGDPKAQEIVNKLQTRQAPCDIRSKYDR